MPRKPKQNGHDYGSEVIDSAISELSGGVNLEAGSKAVNFALQALEKQAKALAQADYADTKPELVGRTAAYTAKLIDETTRLIAFTKGGPDSRVETQATQAEAAAMDKLFSEYSNDQLAQMRHWRKENRGCEAPDENQQ